MAACEEEEEKGGDVDDDPYVTHSVITVYVCLIYLEKEGEKRTEERVCVCERLFSNNYFVSFQMCTLQHIF